MACLGDGGDFGGERDPLAFLQALGVADEGLPAPRIEPLVQRGADHCSSAACPHATAGELGRNNARVVEHQHVARTQELRQIGDGAVRKRPLARHNQHARRIARARRAQRDKLGREVEIEQVDAHGGGLSG